jgi:hypothetical protein
MANDWLKVNLDIHEKPEVMEMASMLSMNVLDVVGRLIRVWAWFDKNTENGHAKRVTYVTVDHFVGHTGFAEAMNMVGWLEQEGAGLSIPNFDRHNGESAKKRALAAERQRKSRSQKDVTLSQKSVTREEKRREEIKSSRPPQELKVHPQVIHKQGQDLDINIHEDQKRKENLDRTNHAISVKQLLDGFK